MDKKHMERNTEALVSGGLASVLRLVRVSGMAPLNFDRIGDGWRVTFSKGWSIYGYCMITAINIVTCTSLNTEMKVLDKEATGRTWSVTQRVVRIVQVSCMVIASWAAVFAVPALMRSVIACLNQVQKINCNLNIRKRPVSLGRNMIRIAVIQTLACVMLSLSDYVLAVLSSFQLQEETWIHVVYWFYFVSYWVVQVRTLQFTAIVLHVKYSFKVVNNDLMTILKDFDNLKTPFSKEMINVIKKYSKLNNYINSLNDLGSTDSASTDYNFPSESSTVRHLGLVYAALCSVLRDVNEGHGPMVLVILANFFLHLICTPYFLIIFLLKDVTSQTTAALNDIKLAIQLIWCIYHTCNLVTIVEPCHLTHMEMVKTRELVGHLMRCTKSDCDPLAFELEQFFRYLILNEVSYEPLKVIKMTRSLIFTLLGSITTYTVVIIHL